MINNACLLLFAPLIHIPFSVFKVIFCYNTKYILYDFRLCTWLVLQVFDERAFHRQHGPQPGSTGRVRQAHRRLHAAGLEALQPPGPGVAVRSSSGPGLLRDGKLKRERSSSQRRYKT